jgi:hypothetical protein
MGFSKTASDETFADRATTALESVRASLAVMLDSIDSLQGHRPVDLVDTLGIDMKLAWKISRLLRSIYPAEVIHGLPGRTGFKKILSAAAMSGANEGLVDQLRETFDHLLGEMITLSGSRILFETMVAGLDCELDTVLAVDQRRQFFNGARCVSGIQSDLEYRIDLLGPSSEEGMIQCATLRMTVGLVRYHKTASWDILPTVVDKDGVHRCSDCRVSADGSQAGDSGSNFLVPELCEGAGVELVRVGTGNASGMYSFTDDLIGPDSRRTLAVSDSISASVVTPSDLSKRSFQDVMPLRTPTESVVLDILLHRDLFNSDCMPRVGLYSDLFESRSGCSFSGTGRMPMMPSITCISDVRKLDAPRNWSASDFDRVLASCFDKSRWGIDQFICRRIEVAYPPVPATLVSVLDLVH